MIRRLTIVLTRLRPRTQLAHFSSEQLNAMLAERFTHPHPWGVLWWNDVYYTEHTKVVQNFIN